MSLKPTPIEPVPEGTARVAKAAFRRGNPLLSLRDELGATLLHGSARLTWGTGWRRVQLAGPRTGPGECPPRRGGV